MRKKIKKLNPVDVLEGAGLSPTMQRVAVLRYLLLNEDHPTVKTIYQAVKKEIPTLSKTTVYNTLEAFKESSLVITVSSDSDEQHYDIGLADHMHFVCRVCGDIYDMKPAQLRIKSVMDGHKIEQHDITLRGVCKKCRKEN